MEAKTDLMSLTQQTAQHLLFFSNIQTCLGFCFISFFSLQAGEMAAEIKRKIEKKEKKKKKREKRKLEALSTAEGEEEEVGAKKAKSNGDAETQVSELYIE